MTIWLIIRLLAEETSIEPFEYSYENGLLQGSSANYSASQSWTDGQIWSMGNSRTVIGQWKPLPSNVACPVAVSLSVEWGFKAHS